MDCFTGLIIVQDLPNIERPRASSDLIQPVIRTPEFQNQALNRIDMLRDVSRKTRLTKGNGFYLEPSAGLRSFTDQMLSAIKGAPGSPSL